MTVAARLPPHMPASMKSLSTNPAGYPIPWFVDRRSGPVGNPDFRVMDARRLREAVMKDLCWVCGGRMNRSGPRVFVAGPMCLVNLNSAEPPSHAACARWSTKACPFLVNPRKVRRETNIPETGEVAGEMIARNPGVTALIFCDGYTPWNPGNGILFRPYDPTGVEWFSQGRPATRAEVEESIDTGLPVLMEMAEAQDAEEPGAGAVNELARQVEAARKWLPAPDAAPS